MNNELLSEWQQVLEDLCRNEQRVLLDQKLDNSGKVKACYLNKFVKDTLWGWLELHSKYLKYTKNQQEATKCRTKGNEFYKKGNLKKSLYYYSKAIFVAPIGSEEIELAFGNRSAVLFSLEKYEECISDIKYALSIDKSPSARDVRLVSRKAKALERLQKYPDAIVAYSYAKKIILNCREDDRKKLSHVKSEIDHSLDKLKHVIKSNITISDKNGNYEEFHLILDSFVSEPEFPSACSKLSLMENKIKGRHVIAKCDISAGELLFVEKPFAFVVLPPFSYERCQNCCKFINNPLPCEHCIQVGFCNEDCRKLAWHKFHKWECGFGIELNYMIGIAHLGFRVAIVGFTNPINHEYKRVKMLQQHISSLEPDDLYQYTLTATVLVLYLEKYTNFQAGPNRLESLLEFGGIILLHITQMVCNGHAITDVIMTDNSVSEREIFDEEQVRVATAIYPSASMMNHSCDPSIINGFKDEYLIVRAVKMITKGEEVYNCYGPHYRRMSKEERRSNLMQQYMFLCNCKQCNSKEDFINRFIGYSCQNTQCDGTIPANGMHCTKCQLRITEKCIKEVKKARDDFELAKYAALDQDYQRSVTLGEKALKCFSKYFYKNHKEILDCKDLISKMFIPLGHYYQSYKLIEENIAGNKDRFGNNSIEVANEIVKLSDIGVHILNTYFDEDVKDKQNIIYENIFKGIPGYIKEGRKIFKLHYGKMNEKYKDLDERLNVFQSAAIHF